MGELKKKLQQMNREHTVEQIVTLIREEAYNKQGLNGVVLKRAYKTLISMKPNADSIAVDLLLDDIVEVFDGHYSGWKENASVDFSKYCELNKAVIAGEILEVTDEKDKQTGNKKFSSMYSLVRGAAHSYIRSAVPKLGEFIVEKLTE